MNHLEKAARFRELHFRPGIFVVPNPWDSGSAKFLAHLGFEALATTSAGLAYGLGRADGRLQLSREDALKNATLILEATDLPVTADLENGFGDSADDCALTIKLAAATGLSGCSIEDATGRPDQPIFGFELAVQRVKAAMQAKRALNQPFTLTARAENFLYGNPDISDTIRRLVAYAEAGADVLYAPGIKNMADIKAVVGAVSPQPVNILMGFADMSLTLKDLEAVGVKRVSVGSSMARAAYGALQQAGTEILKSGTFNYAQGAISYQDLNQLFDAGKNE